VTDATAAMLIAVLLFMLPSERPAYLGGAAGPKPALLTWEVAATKLPWGILLLLGGGFALADCISVSQDIFPVPFIL